MKNKIEIELGESFFMGISFAGGIFGFSWIPFLVVCIFFLLRLENEDNEK